MVDEISTVRREVGFNNAKQVIVVADVNNGVTEHDECRNKSSFGFTEETRNQEKNLKH